MTLSQEVVIITGSTKGIGRSLAFHLAREGAAVVVNSRKNVDVELTVQEIRNLGGRAVGFAGPVEEMETGRKLCETAIEAFGVVTILVNNAGVVRDRISYRMTEQEWDEVLSTHLKGTFSATSPVIQHMVENNVKGTIMNMTSLAGLQGAIGQLNYSTAKAGLLGFTWSLAKELKAKGIQVFAVAPAAITDMTRPHIEKALQLATGLGEDLPDYWKIGTADEVASFIIQLLAKRSQFETGQIFQVNGKEIGRWLPPVFEKISSNGEI
ncbi:SDR family NAD(P)-dependent oxidoreductase [Bacillus sp. DJP31]|uniref:SDR family NAD(P)-dependent oxidoreductase n=1 Tax=Bacillus sp. DJP31 TaxID=3409789 RepID=UPI003BB7B47B